jgi:hypothetical protein
MTRDFPPKINPPSCVGFWYPRQKITCDSPAKNTPFFLGFWNYRQKITPDSPEKEIPLPFWVLELSTNDDSGFSSIKKSPILSEFLLPAANNVPDSLGNPFPPGFCHPLPKISPQIPHPVWVSGTLSKQRPVIPPQFSSCPGFWQTQQTVTQDSPTNPSSCLVFRNPQQTMTHDSPANPFPVWVSSSPAANNDPRFPCKSLSCLGF